VLQGAGLVLGKDDNLPGSFGEAFEQIDPFLRVTPADWLRRPS
jgi:hypothetical protein